MTRQFRLTLWMLFGLLASMCQCNRPQLARQHLDFEGTLIEANGSNSEVRSHTLDDQALAEEANDLYRAHGYPEALRKYELLLEHWPKSLLAFLAAYNAGLCAEHMKQWNRAVDFFRQAQRAAASAQDARDARFHQGKGLTQQQSWEEARAIFSGLLQEDLEDVDQLEALAQAGYCSWRAGDALAAERLLRQALDVFQRSGQLQGRRTQPFGALAHFTLGEIYRDLFTNLPIRWPIERMKRDVEQKASLLMSAQHMYFEALRMQDRQWSVAAGVSLAAMYETFHLQLLSTDPPSDLSAAQADEYVSHLRHQVRPLIEKALLGACREKNSVRDRHWRQARYTEAHGKALHSIRTRTADAAPPRSSSLVAR